jgi:catechol 2,3-dioxygenase-like lactoylglutathione lyase family enzyme
MSTIGSVGRVMVPVADQDEAIAFYTESLGFTVSADTPFGENDRWVEVTPPGGGAALALVPSRENYAAGRMTGIALETPDAAAARETLAAKGVDVDPLLGGDGQVPSMFFLRDRDENTLMLVEQP